VALDHQRKKISATPRKSATSVKASTPTTPQATTPTHSIPIIQTDSTPTIDASLNKRTHKSDERGRPKKLRFNSDLQDTGNAVWETTDHDYLKTKTCKKSTPELISAMHELVSLRTENKLLHKQVLSIESIKEDDRTFQFYTNFPNYAVFSALVEYLSGRAKGNLTYWRGPNDTLKFQHFSESMSSRPGPQRKLSFDEEFFLVLVKLKTGLFNKDLAFRLNVSEGLVSQVLSTWLNFLAQELKLLFEMAKVDHEDAYTGIPHCYKAMPKLQIVLDCTELMSQTATSLAARKQTYSNYKSHDTVKFLVGISPNLCVNYVSKAWGGRATDKHITLHSDSLLENLKRGNSVMADRGFVVGQELQHMGVKLVIPDFKGRDRPQMKADECASSEDCARARIHIERAIQRIRTFHILDRVVKLTMKDVIEQIFTVCAYLTNFQLPIVRL
jgi:hypothetical protein